MIALEHSALMGHAQIIAADSRGAEILYGKWSPFSQMQETSKHDNRKLDPEPNPRAPGSGRLPKKNGSGSLMARFGPQTHNPNGMRSEESKKPASLCQIPSCRLAKCDGKVKSNSTIARAGDDDDEDEANPRDPGHRAF
jgi:hypothetical protein